MSNLVRNPEDRFSRVAAHIAITCALKDLIENDALIGVRLRDLFIVRL